MTKYYNEDTETWELGEGSDPWHCVETADDFFTSYEEAQKYIDEL